MTLEDFVAMFENVGMPIAFDHFKTAQKLPYLVYIVSANDQFAADNKTFHSVPVLQLELYTEQKDMEKETAVETIIDDFFYTKEEEYLDDEQMYMVAYRFVLQK